MPEIQEQGTQTCRMLWLLGDLLPRVTRIRPDLPLASASSDTITERRILLSCASDAVGFLTELWGCQGQVLLSGKWRRAESSRNSVAPPDTSG